MEKRWSKAEIAHLRKHAQSQSVDELARRLATDKETVRRKLTELKLAPGADGDDGGDTLERFGKAVGLVHDGEWEQAKATLEGVLAASDSRQLSARVQQYLNLCYQNLEQVSGDGDDPYLRAVFEKNQGNLESALALCQKHGNPEEEERVAYLMASIRALTGHEKEALSYLAIAIRLEPKNRIHAYHDPDFKALRNRDEFARLLSSAAGKSAKGAAGRR